MKENVLDVLMYLFENYMYDEPDSDPDRDSLHVTLTQAGFSQTEINKAFDWLDGLADHSRRPQISPRSEGPTRIYTQSELQRLDTACQGMLLYLEDAGILDSAHRELVIDRVMALDSEEVDIEDLKWIVLLVLFSQPGQEAQYAYMENLMFDGQSEYLH